MEVECGTMLALCWRVFAQHLPLLSVKTMHRLLFAVVKWGPNIFSLESMFTNHLNRCTCTNEWRPIKTEFCIQLLNYKCLACEPRLQYESMRVPHAADASPHFLDRLWEYWTVYLIILSLAVAHIGLTPQLHRFAFQSAGLMQTLSSIDVEALYRFKQWIEHK